MSKRGGGNHPSPPVRQLPVTGDNHPQTQDSHRTNKPRKTLPYASSSPNINVNCIYWWRAGPGANEVDKVGVRKWTSKPKAEVRWQTSGASSLLRCESVISTKSRTASPSCPRPSMFSGGPLMCRYVSMEIWSRGRQRLSIVDWYGRSVSFLRQYTRVGPLPNSLNPTKARESRLCTSWV